MIHLSIFFYFFNMPEKLFTLQYLHYTDLIRIALQFPKKPHPLAIIQDIQLPTKVKNITPCLISRTYGLRVEYSELILRYFRENMICSVLRFGLPLNEFCDGFIYSHYKKYLVKKYV